MFPKYNEQKRKKKSTNLIFFFFPKFVFILQTNHYDVLPILACMYVEKVHLRITLHRKKDISIDYSRPHMYICRVLRVEESRKDISIDYSPHNSPKYTSLNYVFLFLMVQEND